MNDVKYLNITQELYQLDKIWLQGPVLEHL